MLRPPPRATRPDPHFPYTTLFRSALGPGPKREAVGADGLFLDVQRQAEVRLVQHLDAVDEALRPLDPAVAARSVQVAADRHKRVEGTEGLHAGAHSIDAVTAAEGAWPGGTKPCRERKGVGGG